jgi:YHS domain-containing protein
MSQILMMLMMLVFVLPADSTPTLPRQTPAEAAPALKGFDPVLMVQGKEVKGDPKISLKRGEYRYLFATAENKAQFEKEPKRYEIQLGGSCPVVPGAEGNPDLFLVYKEKIYIFATEHCVNEFKANPKNYVD